MWHWDRNGPLGLILEWKMMMMLMYLQERVYQLIAVLVWTSIKLGFDQLKLTLGDFFVLSLSNLSFRVAEDNVKRWFPALLPEPAKSLNQELVTQWELLWIRSYRPPLWARWQHVRLSCSGPGFEPRSGQVSWVRFSRGFSSPVRQMSGSFRPQGPRISFGHHYRHHSAFSTGANDLRCWRALKP